MHSRGCICGKVSVTLTSNTLLCIFLYHLMQTKERANRDHSAEIEVQSKERQQLLGAMVRARQTGDASRLVRGWVRGFTCIYDYPFIASYLWLCSCWNHMLLYRSIGSVCTFLTRICFCVYMVACAYEVLCMHACMQEVEKLLGHINASKAREKDARDLERVRISRGSSIPTLPRLHLRLYSCRRHHFHALVCNNISDTNAQSLLPIACLSLSIRGRELLFKLHSQNWMRSRSLAYTCL